MSDLRPEGTARTRWLASRAASEEDAGVPVDDPVPSYLGWEIAHCASALSGEERTALARLAAACVASTLAGNTRLWASGAPLEIALDEVGGRASIAAANALLVRARVGEPGDPIAAVMGRPGARTPLVVDGDWLYLERMLALETRFSDRVRALADRTDEAPDPRALRRAIAAVSPGERKLTREQTDAIIHALAAPLSLISGGPGTGKTLTVVALVRAAAWLGVPTASLALAAPTGKAAQRLTDALGEALGTSGGDIADQSLRASPPAPMTLHRLLGWSPRLGRFAHHEGHRLPYRVVIVDEASMVDLAMMDRVVRALPDRGRLVLVGDADQLPSVEAGAVFRDLCRALGASKLTTNLRAAGDPSGRAIVSLASAINAGGDPSAGITVRTRAEDVDFRGVEHLDARWSEVGDAVLERWYAERIAGGSNFLSLATRVYRRRENEFEAADRAALEALVSAYGRARILVATRSSGFPACADAINQSLLSRLPRGESAPWNPRRGAHALGRGSPVVVEHNDYVRGVFNGDQGVVVSVDAGEREGPRPMMALLRGSGIETFSMAGHASVAPAFAMTVHKAQGSEFDHVVLVLPDTDHPLLTRELVYTAVTRARRSVLIAGPREVFARAVARTSARSSGVAQRLRAAAVAANGAAGGPR